MYPLAIPSLAALTEARAARERDKARCHRILHSLPEDARRAVLRAWNQDGTAKVSRVMVRRAA